MRIILISLMSLMLGACSISSYHGAGLEERTANCIKDIFDPMNRGSGC